MGSIGYLLVIFNSLVILKSYTIVLMDLSFQQYVCIKKRGGALNAGKPVETRFQDMHCLTYAIVGSKFYTLVFH